MALHDELLNLARELVDRNVQASPPIDGELRRAISTSYYALFHLLVHEATTRIIAIADLRPRVARAFEHSRMKDHCMTLAKLQPDAAGNYALNGVAVPSGIVRIASEFVALQEARHQADYSLLASPTPAQAGTEVQRAENAFAEWATVAADPAAEAFLVELLCLWTYPRLVGAGFGLCGLLEL